MKNMRLLNNLIFYLVLFSFSSCKKDVVELLFKNNSFIECKINGTYARGEGLRKMFEDPSSFHMNYSYEKDGSFTFNIAKNMKGQDSKNYRIYISVTQNSLPELGERYYFKKQIDNNGPFYFEDKSYIASIEVIPYFINVQIPLLYLKTSEKGRLY